MRLALAAIRIGVSTARSFWQLARAKRPQPGDVVDIGTRVIFTNDGVAASTAMQFKERA